MKFFELGMKFKILMIAFNIQCSERKRLAATVHKSQLEAVSPRPGF